MEHHRGHGSGPGFRQHLRPRHRTEEPGLRPDRSFHGGRIQERHRHRGQGQGRIPHRRQRGRQPRHAGLSPADKSRCEARRGLARACELRRRLHRCHDSTREGDYAEGSVGFAYRPAAGDRFNMLAKYTYLYDLPARTRSASTAPPRARRSAPTSPPSTRATTSSRSSRWAPSTASGSARQGIARPAPTGRTRRSISASSVPTCIS